MRALFVTGTDTGVGKTRVTAGLAVGVRLAGVSVGVMKPVETGCAPGPAGLRAADAEVLAEFAGVMDADELVCPARYELPLAPAVAAELEGRPVDRSAIRRAFAALAARYRLLLVEGAGGLAVPLGDGAVMADLAAESGGRVLVVARPGLGTLNHTILTVEYARARGLRVLGVAVNRWPETPGLVERTNLARLPEVTGVPAWPVAECGAEPERVYQAVARGGLLAEVLAALVEDE